MQDKEELKGKYALVKELYSDVGRYRSTEEFQDLLNFMERFVHLSSFNAFLIHCQNSGSLFVATPTQWRDKYKRRIKPGARAMVILWPFGPVRFVYDLKDTEGDEPFPRELLEPFNVEGHIEQHFYDSLIDGLSFYGIRYAESDIGSAGAASIRTTKEQEFIYKNNVKKDIYYHLIVRSDLPIESKFSAVIHELGHLFCGHLGLDKTGKKFFKDRHNVGEVEGEFEAETVCYIVCRRLGIKPHSDKYLAGYLRKTGDIPEIRLDLVIKAVGMIEDMISLLIDKQKELRKKWYEKEMKYLYKIHR